MSQPAMPVGASDISTRWLQHALDAGGAGIGTLRDVEVEDIGDGTGALGQILRCSLGYEDEDEAPPSSKPPSIIVKLASTDRRSLRIAKLMSMYQREYLFLSRLAPQIVVDSPTLCYGAFDDRSHRFVLLLEDLRHMTALDQLEGADPVHARAAVRGAARLHGSFWGRVDQAPVSDFLAAVGGSSVLLTQMAYLYALPICLHRFGGAFTPQMQRLARSYGARMHAYMAEAQRHPQTLVHGDYRLENLFFGSDDPDALAVIDWQTAGLFSNGLYDIAYFMATSVEPEIRREIERPAVAEYHGIIRDMGADGYSFDECWRSYRHSILGILTPSVIAAGALDMANERIRSLGEAALRRTLTAICDLGAADMLPQLQRALSVSALRSAAWCSMLAAHTWAHRLTRLLPQRRR